MPAKVMNMTIPPTVVCPREKRTSPTMRIASMVKVVDVLVSVFAKAHQDRTGICAPSRRSTTLRRSRTSTSTRVKLCTNATLPRVSEARSARSE